MATIYTLIVQHDLIDKEDEEYHCSTDINECHIKLKQYIKFNIASLREWDELGFIIKNDNIMKNFKLVWEQGDVYQLIDFWNQISKENVQIINNVEPTLAEMEVSFPSDLILAAQKKNYYK